VTRPRAADDFDRIHERIRELRGEPRVAQPPAASQPSSADALPTDHERRLKDRREGLPPPWVPTIFIKKPASGKRPTNLEIARRFWHIRAGR
jgi:hypothetical protein